MNTTDQTQATRTDKPIQALSSDIPAQLIDRVIARLDPLARDLAAQLLHDERLYNPDHYIDDYHASRDLYADTCVPCTDDTISAETTAYYDVTPPSRSWEAARRAPVEPYRQYADYDLYHIDVPFVTYQCRTPEGYATDAYDISRILANHIAAAIDEQL